MNRFATVADPATPSPNGHNGHDQPSANAANGRDERGRFTRGNPGGTGNPFARQTAALRRALVESITEEDICAIAQKLKDMALAGNLAALKLLLSYVVGRPTAAPDPDTLDLQEWAILKQGVPMGQELADLSASMTPEHLAAYGRAAQAASSEQYLMERLEELADIQEEAREEAEREERQRQRARERRTARQAEADAARRPSANGDNGEAGLANRPSANGGDGSPRPPFRPSANGGNGVPASPGSIIAPSANGGNGDGNAPHPQS